MRNLLMLVVALLILPVAAAQSQGGGHITAETPTIYPHFESDSGRWASTLADEPHATQGSSGGNPLIHPLGPLNGYTFPTYHWTYPLAPALAEPVELDMAGTIDVEIHANLHLTYATTAPTPYMVDISWELRQGGTLLVAGSPQSAGPGGNTNTVVLTWSEPVPHAVLDPGAGNLEWYIEFDGPAANYWTVTESPDATRMTFPVVAAAPETTEPPTTFENLTGDQVGADFVFENGTTSVHQSNWTSLANGTHLQYEGNGTGNVSFLVIDDAGSELHNATIVDAGSFFETLATAGQNITIRVGFDNYTGSFSWSMGPVPETDGGHGTGGDQGQGGGPGGHEGGSDDADQDTDPGDGNETADLNGDDGKDTPAAFVAPALVLAAMAARRRR